VVIAGEADAIAEAGAIAKELGARKVMPLPVGGAFHTPFMASAAARLRTALQATTFADSEIPVIANVDAEPHRDGAGTAARLEAQLTSPVRWQETIARMVADGVTTFVELGPGAVLTGVAKRSAPDGTAVAAADPAALDAVVQAATAAGAMDLHDGEHLFAAERLVVSPAAGIFVPAGLAEGEHIERGRVVGHVAGEAIRSPFRGAVMGLLAVAGERLTRSQPVAWLRTA
jgi:[acyl-carrier-protein] S-malonyltransferase